MLIRHMCMLPFWNHQVITISCYLIYFLFLVCCKLDFCNSLWCSQYLESFISNSHYYQISWIQTYIHKLKRANNIAIAVWKAFRVLLCVATNNVIERLYVPVSRMSMCSTSTWNYRCHSVHIIAKNGCGTVETFMWLVNHNLVSLFLWTKY